MILQPTEHLNTFTGPPGFWPSTSPSGIQESSNICVTGGPQALTQGEDDCQKQTQTYPFLVVIEISALEFAWQMEA